MAWLFFCARMRHNETFKIWSQFLPSLWMRKVRFCFPVYDPEHPLSISYSLLQDWLPRVRVHPFFLLCDAGKCLNFLSVLSEKHAICKDVKESERLRVSDYKCMQYIHAYWGFCHQAGCKVSTVLNVLFVMYIDFNSFCIHVLYCAL